ncbi:MAG: hypothetical protein N2446_02890 [Elusimicrobiales bacterium]|nr:hypothetical protein [Elusimicrobiales bacterium]
MNKDVICGLSCYSTFLKIVLRKGDKEISFSRKLVNFDDIIFKQFNKMLSKMDSSFKDIDTICIVRGPGRFTAIRSIYTFATVYQALSKCKVLGVDVFGCLSYNVFKKDNSDKDIAIISHAFKNEYYLGFYKIRKKKLFEYKKPRWLLLEDIINELRNFKGVVIYDKDEFDIDLSLLEKNENISFPSTNLMKIIPSNIINSSFYFLCEKYEPIYLKPAKFETSK